MLVTFIDREFAGEMRRFQLFPADQLRLYRGIEGENLGNLSEIAQRAKAEAMGAASGTLGALRIERIIVHALSRGHPITLLRMQDVVRDEMRDKPLSNFIGLVVEIIATSYAGSEQ